MSATQEIQAQTRVLHLEKRIGIVVPDSMMSLCGPGSVMVEFDGGEVMACLVSDLEAFELIEITFDHQNCAGCIFADGRNCHRYNTSRYARMMDSQGKKHIPKQLYPNCQQEE
jgi:hypothetical protein